MIQGFAALVQTIMWFYPNLDPQRLDMFHYCRFKFGNRIFLKVKIFNLKKSRHKRNSQKLWPHTFIQRRQEKTFLQINWWFPINHYLPKKRSFLMRSNSFKKFTVKAKTDLTNRVHQWVKDQFIQYRWFFWVKKIWIFFFSTED